MQRKTERHIAANMTLLGQISGLGESHRVIESSLLAGPSVSLLAFPACRSFCPRGLAGE